MSAMFSEFIYLFFISILSLHPSKPSHMLLPRPGLIASRCHHAVKSAFIPKTSRPNMSLSLPKPQGGAGVGARDAGVQLGSRPSHPAPAARLGPQTHLGVTVFRAVGTDAGSAELEGRPRCRWL